MIKKILVTGATRGIGRKIFEEMLSVGEVFGLARNAEKLEELKTLGAKDVLQCDILNDVEGAKEFIYNNGINVLVNNAGIYNYSALVDEDENVVRNIIRTNVEAPIILSKYVLKNMKEQKWGRIINIGSISGVMGEANASVYSASKASLIGFSKSLLKTAAPSASAAASNHSYYSSHENGPAAFSAPVFLCPVYPTTFPPPPQ